MDKAVPPGVLRLPSLVSPIREKKGPPDLHLRVAKREGTCRYFNNEGLKDLTSSSLNIKGPKAAEQRDTIDMRILRAQLKAYPEYMRERYRVEMGLEEEKRARDLQDFQMIMLLKLQKLLVEQMLHVGDDPRKFHIGGHERGLYERFFKTQPMRYMTEPQFVSAMKKVFGDGAIKKREHEMTDLYHSFDKRRLGQMEWRSLMCLIIIVMVPDMPFEKYLQYSFVLYASSGSFDLDCRDKIPLRSIKQIFSIPVRLVFQQEVEAIVGQAWAEISIEDYEAVRASQNLPDPTDPESVQISLPLFRRMLHKTLLKDYIKMGQPFGTKDLRTWTYRFEDLYYHSAIPPLQKKKRREYRNEDEVIKFRALADKRLLRFPFATWKKIVTVRQRTRILFIDCSIRWKNIQCADFFDMWRKVIIEETASVHICRIVRGFCARKRKIFIRQLHRRVVKIQAQVRQVSKRVIYKGIFLRKRWAAIHIQRVARGVQARRRVMGIIEGMVDTQVRKYKKMRAEFAQQELVAAAECLQRSFRRYRRSKKALEEVTKKFEAARVEKQMDKVLNAGIVERNLFKEQLKQWYDARREVYFKDRLDRHSTAEAKRRILAYRNRDKVKNREEAAKRRDLMRKKMEENKIENFVKKWEILIAERLKERERMCHQALLIPETPEEEDLKKALQAKIKKHTDVVLKRADKQKIPMERPEAMDIAQIEMIEAEIKAEKKQCDKDMRAEADEIERQEEVARKKEKALEAKVKFKKRGWASVVIQKSYRGYLGRIIGRDKCFKRYKKHYDVPSGQYFYVDFKTKRTMWKKPVMFGSYDIDADEGWLVLRDTQDEPYYYNPRKLTMQWETPFDVVFCEKCKRDFAVGRLSRDVTIYCDACMVVKVGELLHKLPPGRIWFKPIQGNLEGSALKDVEMIDEISWADHLASLDPEHGKKGEDEDEPEIREQYCCTCEDEVAVVKCEMCMTVFCANCYDLKHRKAPWNNHVKSDLPRAEKKEPKKIKDKRASVKGNGKVKAPKGPAPGESPPDGKKKKRSLFGGKKGKEKNEKG
jgi:hypothetical protein